MKLTQDITIRDVLPVDADQAARLSAELGYPISLDVMANRLAQFLTTDNHSVFGAYIQTQLIAWIDVGIPAFAIVLLTTTPGARALSEIACTPSSA